MSKALDEVGLYQLC